MKNILFENLVKNVILISILVPSYFWVNESFKSSAQLFTGTLEGSLLVGAMVGSISILLVAACFGNFAFTYEKITHTFNSRFLAHLTTGLFMLLIGLSLEMTSVVISLFVGKFPVFDVSLVILYIASVFYDFWDLKRSELK
ncbi:hypothetical protein HYU94_03605 [Candidatus Daviesbacteria bacterium]|nr:hypothetical protein [Candidatus Daviesbacteria bacterium]